MFIVAQIPPQRLMSLAPALYVVGVGLLIAVAVFGLTKKGARRWINVGIVIQPSAGGHGGTFIPKGIRWAVERSLGWISRYRRLR